MARSPAATIITDDWSGYAKLGERGYCHTAVVERGDMQVAETFLPVGGCDNRISTEETNERVEVSRVIDQVSRLAHDLACEIDNSDIAAAE